MASTFARSWIPRNSAWILVAAASCSSSDTSSAVVSSAAAEIYQQTIIDNLLQLQDAQRHLSMCAHLAAHKEAVMIYGDDTREFNVR